jgi:type IV secretory pathway VirB3-like protein
MQAQELRVYPLFVALTRAPMTMGVTQTFFVLNFVPCMVLFLATMNIILAAGIFIVLHLFGMVCCWKDEQFFEILLGKFELICPNRRRWGCNSYDPE